MAALRKAIALFSFILHDAAEGDAGGILDADMHELPADAEMAIDDTGATSGDAVPYGATGKASAAEVGVSAATVSRILSRARHASASVSSTSSPSPGPMPSLAPQTLATTGRREGSLVSAGLHPVALRGTISSRSVD